MSSLARRTLRTTAAAAGVAALGVGLVGNAVAAPAAPAPAPTPDVLPSALPALPSDSPLAALPGVPDGPALPMLFVFEGPTINTAGPAGSHAARPTPVRTAPAATESDPAQVGPTRVGPAYAAPTSPGADRVGALSELDTTRMFDDLAAQAAVDQRGLGTGALGLDGLFS